MFNAAHMGLFNSGELTDPYFLQVALLVNFASGALTDKSNNARTLSIVSGSVVSSVYKWPQIGYSFDTGGGGTGNGGFSFPDNANLDITGAFTLEAWIRPNTGGGDNKVLDGDGVSTYRFGFKSNYGTMGGEGIGGFGGTTGMTVDGSTWYHACWERNASNTIRNYINGAIVHSPGAVAGTLAPNTSVHVCKGYYAGEYAPMYMGEVRLTIGTARYNGAFTTPSAPFPTK